MAKSSEMLEKLRTALPPLTKEPESAPKPLHNFQGSRSVRAPKLSVSLYQSDIAQLDRIREHMRIAGVRTLTDSEAIRLACRRAELDTAMIDIYYAMQHEDGRKKVK